MLCRDERAYHRNCEQYRGTEHIRAFVRHGETDYGTFLRFQKYDLQAAYAPRQTAKPLGSGIVLELAEDRFLLIGMNTTFTFLPKPGVVGHVNFLSLEEGTVEAGEWKKGRTLNGDEKMSLRIGDRLTCLMAEVFTY